MSRVPIRVRLTAAFALAMVVVLVGAGAFVYLRLSADLNDAIEGDLQARVVAGPSDAAGDAEEQLTQLMRFDGKLIASKGLASEPVLSGDAARALAYDGGMVEREVDGYDADLRLAANVVTNKAGGQVFVVGVSLEDRNEALGSLVASFAIGGAIAVAIASLLGYLLAAAGLRPVEAMRRRAAQVSLEHGGDQLPLPIAHDELRRLGETLNEMLDRLHESFERERRFVADASHELRTPIAVVKTELEGTLRSGEVGPGARESLVAAVEECDHLTQLAEDLLVLARAGEGKLPVRREPIVVAELLEGVRDRFADRARERGRDVRIECADDLRLSGDRQHLRRALGNLLDNALRYGEGDVLLAATSDGELIELEVSDSGRGFAPEFGGKAFERFTRRDDARTRGGTGLGLAIVQAVAEAHGGSAEILGERLATVRISLPKR